MNWFEIKIATAHESVEAVCDMMMSLDIDGVVIEDPDDEIFNESYDGDWDYIALADVIPDEPWAVVKCYVSHIDSIPALTKRLLDGMERIREAGLAVGEAQVTISKVNDADWANEWKQYYKPFRVGNRLMVVPTWETYEPMPDDLVMRLDPSGAFGSGTHETTSTCLEALEKYLHPGDTVYDIGCGSGVLSIAAALLGAQEVTGVDFSRTACETALENVRTNEVEERVTILEGNLTDLLDGRVDCFIANIIADVVIQLSAVASDYLKEDGIFITSGIIQNKREEVLAALADNGFTVVEELARGEWVTLVSKRSDRS